MDLLETKRRERLSREAAAERLHVIADNLARHNELEFTRGSTRIRVPVADEVEIEIGIEVEHDGAELEIELKW
jgi:amphi-Trp domain-containing protein